MSLDKRSIKTKNLEVTGRDKDFPALSDIFRQISDRLNIDLQPTDIDIPGRITVRTGGGKTRAVYPRLESALEQFADALEEPDGGVVDFGTFGIEGRPDQIILNSPTLRKMNQSAVGRDLGVGTYFKEDIVGDMESMLDPQFPGSTRQPLSHMVPVWVYASDLVLHEGEVPIGIDVKDMKTLGKLSKYPPDLTTSGDFWGGTKKEGYNRAYFVVMRAEKAFPVDMKIGTRPGMWDAWIKSRPVPENMRLFRGKPPRDFGEYLERYAVYSTARTFGLKDAFLANVHVGTTLGEKVGSTKGYADKFIVTNPIKSKTYGKKIMTEYATYYGFVVVGKGAKQSIQLGKEKPKGAVELPGFD